MHPNKEKYGFDRMFPSEPPETHKKLGDDDERDISLPRYTELLKDYLKCTTLYLNETSIP